MLVPSPFTRNTSENETPSALRSTVKKSLFVSVAVLQSRLTSAPFHHALKLSRETGRAMLVMDASVKGLKEVTRPLVTVPVAVLPVVEVLPSFCQREPPSYF